MTLPANSWRPVLFGALLGLGVMALALIPLLSRSAQVAYAAPPATQQTVPGQPVAAPQQPAQPVLGPDGRMPESVEADVSTRSVAVTSSFTGTEIIVFGTVEHSRQPTAESGYYDVVVVVDGTPSPIVARRKANVAGLWINANSIRFDKVPSYYAIASTRPIEEIADPQVLDKYRIGFQSVHMSAAPQQAQLAPEEMAEYRQAVIRLKEKDQLYQKKETGVAFIGRSLFRSAISLPANVPVGPLVTHTYLFKDGKLLSRHSNSVMLQREGLERYLHNFAFEYPIFYGIFAVFIAVAAGLIASTLFKRGAH